MAKLMAPNIRIDWYPEGHFADPENPTLGELNSGYNLSPAIVTGFTLDFTDTNTVDAATIYDKQTSELFTHSSYEANLQFFLAPRLSNAANEGSYRMAEELFYHNQLARGYLVKRFGYKWDVKYHVNHKVDIFYVQATIPKVVSEENSPVLLEVMFLPLGEAVSGTGVMLPNLIVNGDLSNGTTGWTQQNGTLTSTTSWNHQMWGGLGGSLAMVSSTVGRQYPTGLQNFYQDFKQGEWIGVSAYVANDTGQEIRIQLTFYGDTNYAFTDWLSAPFYTGLWIHEAFEIPHDCDRIRLQVQGKVSTESSKRIWFDKVMAVWALTEDEALARSSVFTPHKDD